MQVERYNSFYNNNINNYKNKEIGTLKLKEFILNINNNAEFLQY